MLIAVTGASGSIGKYAVPKLLERKETHCRLLLRDSSGNRKLLSGLQKQFPQQVSVVFGDVTDLSCCHDLVKDADYVLHLAAMIPPKADHNEELTWKTNYQGTVNLVDAIIQNGNQSALLFFSSVAAYGHRSFPHYWGRVGDPLMPSIFDAYGASKVHAERYILESNLQKYVILRETGVLYDNMMMNNIHDGLMFQTPVNVFIEWVTAKDTSILLDKIITQGNEKKDFWNKVYNIGGGPDCRQTGFETYNDGFRLIGGSAKKMFEPRWHNQINFHCFWFSDSQILEDLFHFRSEGCSDFWKWFIRKHWIYRLGRLLPSSLLKALIFKPLLKNSNAPDFWVKNNITAKITAAFGGMEKYNQIPKTWDQTDLICEHKDYEQMKIHDPSLDLSHGYDETKPDINLDIEDMRQAAAFRGGKVLSSSMMPGDLKSKLTWQCHNGHVFESSPYTVLKAGHWCPECCSPKDTWEYDDLARHIPFFAQVWYDFHERDENIIYYLDEKGLPQIREPEHNSSGSFTESEEIQ